jgi:hypothetical protein
MKTAAVLLLLLLATLGFAQPPDVLWTRTFFDLRDTRFNAVCAMSDGGCVATGSCCVNMFHGFYASTYAARVDIYGNSVWEHDYWLAWGNVQWPFVEGFAVQPVAAGGVVLGIGANGWPPFGAPLLRLDDDGQQVWATPCDPGVSDPSVEITSVCNAEGGGFAVTLHSQSDSARIARVDSDGQLRWRRVTPNATLRSILPLTDGGFVVAGEPGFFVARLDNMGDSLWARRFDLGDSSACQQLLSLSSGGFLMIGGIVNQAAVATVDAEGNLQSSRTYPFSTAFLSGVHCVEGGYLLLSDHLVRVSEALDTLWTRTLPCSDCSGRSVVQTTDSGFVVAGRLSGFASDSAYLVKFSREGLAADNPFILQPSSFRLSIYPNPFNPSTTLAFTLPKSGFTIIDVYDLAGRKVQTLADGMLAAGEHRLTFNGSQLPSGIYFARLQSGEFAGTQKLLLLK